MTKNVACWFIRGILTSCIAYTSIGAAESLFFRVQDLPQPLCLTVSPLSHQDSPILILELCHADTNQAFYFSGGHLFSNTHSDASVRAYPVGHDHIALLFPIARHQEVGDAFFEYHNGYLLDRRHPDECLVPQAERHHAIILYAPCREQKHPWMRLMPNFTDEEIRSPEGLCATFRPSNFTLHLSACTGETAQRWHYNYHTGQISSFVMIHHAPYCWAVAPTQLLEGGLIHMALCRTVLEERFNFLDGQSIFYRRVRGYYVSPEAEVVGAQLYLRTGFLVYPFFHRGQARHEVPFLQEE